jgi:hypothetical protein
MPIRVEEGKGKKNGNAMLSLRLLELLRDWVGKPTTSTEPSAALRGRKSRLAP